MSGENRAERGTPPDGVRARTVKAESPRPAAGASPGTAPLDATTATTGEVKREKPPPALVNAGADAARIHASNIQPKAPAAGLTPAVPRVVLSPEADPRRAPTAPRLVNGGNGDSTRPPPLASAGPPPLPPGHDSARPPAAQSAQPPPLPEDRDSTRPTSPESRRAAALVAAQASPWGAAAVEVVDKSALPSANLPVATPPPAPAKRKSGGGWLRFAAVVVFLLLGASVVRRMRMAASGSEAPSSPQRSYAQAPPLPPEATAEPTATAPVHTRGVAALVPADPDAVAGRDPASDPAADATADLAPSAPPPRPRLAPPPPKPTYKPLFELPAEKAKETP